MGIIKLKCPKRQAQNCFITRYWLFLKVSKNAIRSMQCPGQLRCINSRKAGGPDGIPARIIQEFACELGKPLTDILNSSYQQGTDGSKLLLFLSLRLRSRFGINCALCHLLVAETFVSNWILSDIGDQLDPNQF